MKRNYFLYLLFSFLIFLWLPQVVNAQVGRCARIDGLRVNVERVREGEAFTCTVTVDKAHEGSSTIGCGVSFNGVHATNFCPSDEFFGGWRGNQAQFNCIFPNTNLPPTITSVDLEAFDF